MKKLIFFMSLAVPMLASGTIKTSVITGYWNDPNIWSPVGVPSSPSDTVFINSYVSFNALNVTCTATRLEISPNGQLASGAGGSYFTFNGNVFINNAQIQGYALYTTVTDSTVNNGSIHIKYLTNTGMLINRSVICVDFSFTSGSSVINNAEIGCGNWTNSANVTGTQGRFCISQSFSNSASISGSIDICDASPGGAGDSNTGTIDSSVTLCAAGPCIACTSVGIEERVSIVEINIAPNPVTTVATITLKSVQVQVNAQLVFTLTDIHGRIVKTIPFSGNAVIFDRTGIENGLYFYGVVLPDSSVLSGKMLLN
jgi:hypothetical protein